MNQFQVVRSVEVIDFSHKVGCREQFEQIYLAIKKLSFTPPESGIKFHRKGLKGQEASKKAHVYARGFKMSIITRNQGEFMLVCRRPEYTMKDEMEVRLLDQEFTSKSQRKESQKTSFTNPKAKVQKGLGSCAPAQSLVVNG